MLVNVLLYTLATRNKSYLSYLGAAILDLKMFNHQSFFVLYQLYIRLWPLDIYILVYLSYLGAAILDLKMFNHQSFFVLYQLYIRLWPLDMYILVRGIECLY